MMMIIIIIIIIIIINKTYQEPSYHYGNFE
jgi:uncharacterized integral membrane protein